MHKTDSIYFSIAEMGSYNIFYIHDCDVLCPDCLKEAIEDKEDWTKPIEGSDSIMNDEISRCTNWDQIDLWCSLCDKNLPCEYGDTYETMMEYINNIDVSSSLDEIEKAKEYNEVLEKNGYEKIVIEIQIFINSWGWFMDRPANDITAMAIAWNSHTSVASIDKSGIEYELQEDSILIYI